MKERTKSEPSFLKFILICGFVLIGILFYIWQNFEAVNIGYEIQNLEKQKDLAASELLQNEFYRDKLASLDRIEQIAKNKLDMHVPSDKEIVILDDRQND